MVFIPSRTSSVGGSFRGRRSGESDPPSTAFGKLRRAIASSAVNVGGRYTRLGASAERRSSRAGDTWAYRKQINFDFNISIHSN